MKKSASARRSGPPLARGLLLVLALLVAPLLVAPDAAAGNPIPSATVGDSYSYTFSMGPSANYQVVNGALPPGLSLAMATGVLSGVPTAAGTYDFDITNGASPIGWTLLVRPHAGCQNGPVTRDGFSTGFTQKTTNGAASAPTVSTTQPKELVLAFVSADGPVPGDQVVTAVSGGGLAWSLVGRSNTGGGTAEIWQAVAPSPQPGFIVTATLSAGGYGATVTAASFTGTRGGTAEAVQATDVSKTPTATLRTASRNGRVWAVGHDWTRAAEPTPAAGQRLPAFTKDPKTHDSYWVQSVDAQTTVDANVTVADTIPNKDRWQLVAVDIPGR